MKIEFDANQDAMLVNGTRIPMELLRVIAEPDDSKLRRTRFVLTKREGVSTVTEVSFDERSTEKLCRKCLLAEHPGTGCWRNRRKLRKQYDAA